MAFSPCLEKSLSNMQITAHSSGRVASASPSAGQRLSAGVR